MTPTMQLRFVERKVKLDPFYLNVNSSGSLIPATQTYRILQQLWIKTVEVGMFTKEVDQEWRDVPVEVEP